MFAGPLGVKKRVLVPVRVFYFQFTADTVAGTCYQLQTMLMGRFRGRAEGPAPPFSLDYF